MVCHGRGNMYQGLGARRAHAHGRSGPFAVWFACSAYFYSQKFSPMDPRPALNAGSERNGDRACSQNCSPFTLLRIVTFTKSLTLVTTSLVASPIRPIVHKLPHHCFNCLPLEPMPFVHKSFHHKPAPVGARQ